MYHSNTELLNIKNICILSSYFYYTRVIYFVTKQVPTVKNVIFHLASTNANDTLYAVYLTST